jgi:hypothetical protein
MHTNIQKSEFFSIRYESIDIPGILGRFQARLTNLLCKYLGLTLWIGWVRQEDEQTLIDKVAGKLLGWKGRLLNRTCRLTLVHSILFYVVLYHMTVFTLFKWAIKRIDKIRRNFLWKGSEEATALWMEGVLSYKIEIEQILMQDTM